MIEGGAGVKRDGPNAASIAAGPKAHRQVNMQVNMLVNMHMNQRDLPPRRQPWSSL
jgi:hypothetical protein